MRMMLENIHQIPLCKKGEIVDYALCDAFLAEEISKFKWHKSTKGYAKTTSNGVTFSMHKYVLRLLHLPHIPIYHINRSKLDNRQDNLWLKPLTFNERLIDKENSTLPLSHIHRNISGEAVIITNIGDEVLVDDDTWHQLNKFTWHINREGYPQTKINSKTTVMHRYAVIVCGHHKFIPFSGILCR
jgi:hypothetical protein